MAVEMKSLEGVGVGSSGSLEKEASEKEALLTLGSGGVVRVPEIGMPLKVPCCQQSDIQPRASDRKSEP